MVDTTERAKEEVISPAERLREWYEHGVPLEVLDEERFEAWLDRRSRETIVGIAGNGTICPIATYLYSVVGIEHAYHRPVYDFDNRQEPDIDFHIAVGGDSAALSKHGSMPVHMTNLPEWARQFIVLVDDSEEAALITAEEAAHFLDVIEERRRRAVD